MASSVQSPQSLGPISSPRSKRWLLHALRLTHNEPGSPENGCCAKEQDIESPQEEQTIPPCTEPAPPDGLPTVRGGNASSPRMPQLRALSRHPGPRGLAPTGSTCWRPCERSCAEPTVRVHDTPRPRPGRCR